MSSLFSILPPRSSCMCDRALRHPGPSHGLSAGAPSVESGVRVHPGRCGVGGCLGHVATTPELLQGLFHGETRENGFAQLSQVHTSVEA